MVPTRLDPGVFAVENSSLSEGDKHAIKVDTQRPSKDGVKIVHAGYKIFLSVDLRREEKRREKKGRKGAAQQSGTCTVLLLPHYTE
jgi:hypothetical protein